MLVPVVLKGGNEKLVSKDEFQFLKFNKQIMFFKHSDNWPVIGRDEMCNQRVSCYVKERRQHEVFPLNC